MVVTWWIVEFLHRNLSTELCCGLLLLFCEQVKIDLVGAKLTLHDLRVYNSCIFEVLESDGHHSKLI